MRKATKSSYFTMSGWIEVNACLRTAYKLFQSSVKNFLPGRRCCKTYFRAIYCLKGFAPCFPIQKGIYLLSATGRFWLWILQKWCGYYKIYHFKVCIRDKMKWNRMNLFLFGNVLAFLGLVNTEGKFINL